MKNVLTIFLIVTFLSPLPIKAQYLSTEEFNKKCAPFVRDFRIYRESKSDKGWEEQTIHKEDFYVNKIENLKFPMLCMDSSKIYDLIDDARMPNNGFNLETKVDTQKFSRIINNLWCSDVDHLDETGNKILQSVLNAREKLKTAEVKFNLDNSWHYSDFILPSGSYAKIISSVGVPLSFYTSFRKKDGENKNEKVKNTLTAITNSIFVITVANYIDRFIKLFKGEKKMFFKQTKEYENLSINLKNKENLAAEYYAAVIGKDPGFGLTMYNMMKKDGFVPTNGGDSRSITETINKHGVCIEMPDKLDNDWTYIHVSRVEPQTRFYNVLVDILGKETVESSNQNKLS